VAIDAHTHLDDPAFDVDRADVLARARAVGVSGFVIAGAHPADWDRVVATAEALGAAWTLGVHPWHLVDLGPDAVRAWTEALASRPTPHGIGETGLDHARAKDEAARRLQREAFRAHLALARERDVPVVLHVVRAYGTALDVIERDGLPARGGMIHAWSGAAELVPRAVRLGLMLSFGAVFTHSDRVAAALRVVPEHALLLETDCPDLPLVPGTRGEPADLVAVAAHAAPLRGRTARELLDVATANARRLFPALRT
jgi:TatD DNase family protein